MSLWLPDNVETAIQRLPRRDHPRYQSDTSIEHLAHYGDLIDKSILFWPLMELPERVIGFEGDELELLEQTSFRRDLRARLVFGWSPLCSDCEWFDALDMYGPFDDNYSYWRISSAKPQSEGFYGRVIFIERGTNFNDGKPIFRPESECYLAIVSQDELVRLFEQLTKRGEPISGDLGRFIEDLKFRR